MGMIICNICDKNLGLGPEVFEHKCEEKTIRAHIERLREAARTAETRLESIRNAVLRMVEGLPTLEGEQTTVSTKWLNQLWDAVECNWWEAKTADSFLVRDIAKQSVLIEANYLFRSKRFGEILTTLEKLTKLKKTCEKSYKILQYGDCEFDLSPEDVLNG